MILETIGEHEYSIAHYYIQNGDCMRDPEITFFIDDSDKFAHFLSFTQDNMGIYYEAEDKTENEVEEVMKFLDQWLTNIKEQGFTLYEAQGENVEYRREEEKEEHESEETENER